MDGDLVFIIPSVIHFSQNPLSYSAVRSVFSPEVRAEQTVTTIRSIRAMVPRSRIVLVEMGTSRELPSDLHALPDNYVYVGDRRVVRKAVDGLNKGHGEALGLLLADTAVRKHRAHYYFKLSGRYHLNESFSLAPWLNGGFGFAAKKYDDTCIATRLYGFSGNFYEAWRAAMRKAIPFLATGMAMEHAIPNVITPIRHLAPVGIWGLLAPHNVGVLE